MSFSMQGKVEFWPNCCPRCYTGDVSLDKDHYSWFLRCITCGWMHDAREGKKNSGKAGLIALVSIFWHTGRRVRPRKQYIGNRRRVFAADKDTEF
jgi:hypothetical protein